MTLFFLLTGRWWTVQTHLLQPASSYPAVSPTGQRPLQSEMLGGGSRRAPLRLGSTALFSLLSKCLAAARGEKDKGQALMISFMSPAPKNDQQQEIAAQGSRVAFPWLLCQCLHRGRKAWAPKFFLRLFKFVITKAGCGRKDLQPDSCASEVSGVGWNLWRSGAWVERRSS